MKKTAMAMLMMVGGGVAGDDADADGGDGDVGDCEDATAADEDKLR